MPSYVVTGASRGLGVRIYSIFYLILSDNCTQLEFVNQLSQNSSNVVFALVRKLETAQKVLAISRPNIHVLQADISNVSELKVSVPFPIKHSKFDVLLRT